MNVRDKRPVNKMVYTLLLMFLVSVTSCSTSGNVKVMPVMLKKAEVQISQYKVAIAESVSIDKILDLSATVAFSTNEKLSFKVNNGHLKAVYVKLDQMVNEGDLLAELDTADLENQLERKRIDLKRAELRYDQMLLDLGVYWVNDYTGLQNIKYDIDSINLDIDRIMKQINGSRLVAPFSGIISDLERTEIGNTIQPYKTFITISKPDELVIQSEPLNPPAGDFESDFNDLSGVLAGMKAMIVYGNDEKIELPATITKVVNTDPGIKNSEERVTPSDSPPLFLVDAKPDKKLPDDMKVNSTVSLKINTGKLVNVVIIPRDTIQGFGEDTIVRVINNGKVVKRRVTTGYENKDAKIIVITSGLRPVESVIIE